MLTFIVAQVLLSLLTRWRMPAAKVASSPPTMSRRKSRVCSTVSNGTLNGKRWTERLVISVVRNFFRLSVYVSVQQSIYYYSWGLILGAMLNIASHFSSFIVIQHSVWLQRPSRPPRVIMGEVIQPAFRISPSRPWSNSVTTRWDKMNSSWKKENIS